MKKYQIIYADPPWWYEHSTHKYQLNAPYKLMRDEELISFKGIIDYLDNPGILFMWSTLPRLDFAMKLIEHWGLSYRGVAWIWVKTNKDGSIMGAKGPQTNTIKQTCELVLMASWSKNCRVPKTQDQTIKNALLSQRREHSRKPDEIYSFINRMYPQHTKLELFARQKTEGWDVWGNEVENDIELISAEDKAKLHIEKL